LTLNENTLLTLSQRFIFLERMVYWLNGWNVFNQYPWLGVGLGNAGFFFPKLAPSMGWATFEIRNVLYYLTQLPNVKSFWFRLLAETGIIGFSVFITWIYVLFQSARVSTRSQNPAIKTMALAGQLAKGSVSILSPCHTCG
jgi:O-antigen ligase